MDQTLHRVATKEREEIKRTTKQKMARRHNREGGNHLDQEGNRQTSKEDTDGGLHPAVNGQSLDKMRWDKCDFNPVQLKSWAAPLYSVTDDMQHVIGAWCVPYDLHMTVNWPTEQMCWKQFVVQWGNCKKNRKFRLSVPLLCRMFCFVGWLLNVPAIC